MKRAISVILLCIIVSTLSSHASAEGLLDWLFGWASDIEEFEFELNPDNTSYTLVKYNYLSKQATNQATIPHTYNDLPVTQIGSQAFYSCEQIESVIIPEGVKSIGAYAFYHCDNLEIVVFPESLRSIGEYAFEGCDSLTGLYFLEGVDVEFRAFCECKNLKTVIMDDDETDNSTRYASIDDYAFYECKNLTYVSLGDDVTRIGDKAFYYCEQLTTVAMTNSIFEIGSSAFEYCRNLDKFIFDGCSEDWLDIETGHWWLKDAGDVKYEYLQ